MSFEETVGVPLVYVIDIEGCYDPYQPLSNELRSSVFDVLLRIRKVLSKHDIPVVISWWVCFREEKCCDCKLEDYIPT